MAGLNQAEYGTVKGKIESIGQDANIDSEKDNVYFTVKVKPEKTYLSDKKGEKVNLTLGMVAETIFTSLSNTAYATTYKYDNLIRLTEVT